MTDSTEHEDKMKWDVGYRIKYNRAKKIEKLEAKVAKFERKGKYNSEDAIRVRYMLERTKKGLPHPPISTEAMKKLIRIHKKTNDNLGAHNKPNRNQKEIERLQKERDRLDARLQRLEQHGEISTPEPEPSELKDLTPPKPEPEPLELQKKRIHAEYKKVSELLSRHWYQESILESEEVDRLVKRIGEVRSRLRKVDPDYFD